MARPAVKRTDLLDAAEALFAERGYHGASLRDITRAAGVQIGLASYHFESKDDLFRQVIGRRAEEVCAAMTVSLERALAETGAAIAPARIITAYVQPHLDLIGTHQGWRNYIRLIHQLIAVGDRQNLVTPLWIPYDQVARRYVAAFAKALPDRPVAELESAFHFMRLIMTSVITHSLTAFQAPDVPLQSAETLKRIVRFCAGGFTAAEPSPEDLGQPG